MSDTHIIAGMHSVRTALKHGADGVSQVWVEARRRDKKIRDIVALSKSAGILLHQVDRSELDTIAPGVNHQGAVAQVEVPAALGERDLEGLLHNTTNPPLLLILDGVQDPHNLGACLRSADAAGVLAVIAPKDRSVGLTPTACKVASGAAESVPFIQVTNLVRTIRWLQSDGVWVVGAAGEAETSLYQTDLNGPLALVMGGEEKGMRRLTREACDLLVKLPMLGSVESLNVSVASGICLFEANRQRMNR